MTNLDVIQRFLKSQPGSAKNLRSTGNELYSYRLRIAWRDTHIHTLRKNYLTLTTRNHIMLLIHELGDLSPHIQKHEVIWKDTPAPVKETTVGNVHVRLLQGLLSDRDTIAQIRVGNEIIVSKAVGKLWGKDGFEKTVKKLARNAETREETFRIYREIRRDPFYRRLVELPDGVYGELVVEGPKATFRGKTCYPNWEKGVNKTTVREVLEFIRSVDDVSKMIVSILKEE